MIHRITANMSRLDPLVVTPGDPMNSSDQSARMRVQRVREIGIDRRATMLRLNAAAISAARRFHPQVVLSAHVIVSPAASLIRRVWGIPVVQYLHASEAGTRRRLTEFALGHADAVIAVSRHAAELARRGGADTRLIHRIPPGVDLPERALQERCQLPTILTVSRLEERYKGHDTVIRALPLVRATVGEVQWIVVGDGRLRQPLERMASLYGVGPNCRFLGELSDQQRDSWLERAHVFTMPSRVPGDGFGGEGFGIVYLEAAWRELPVVAGNAGGAVDAVDDGETGLLVDAEDPVAVADALSRLLIDADLRRRLGERGAERAHEFSWSLITRRVEDVLLSAC